MASHTSSSVVSSRSTHCSGSNRWSMMTDALDRALYEASGTAANPVYTKVYQEGQL